MEIQRAKLDLLFELQRLPTEEEIIQKVGISPERYREVMKASKPILSLHSRHAVTQEEFIKGITDVDGVENDNQRQPALLRLALDDVVPTHSLQTLHFSSQFIAFKSYHLRTTAFGRMNYKNHCCNHF